MQIFVAAREIYSYVYNKFFKTHIRRLLYHVERWNFAWKLHVPLKNEGDLKNKDDLKNEDDLKIKTVPGPGLSLLIRNIFCTISK